MNDLKELVVGLYNRDEWTKEQVIARVVNEGVSAQDATQYVNEIYRRLSLGSPLDDLPEVVSEPPPDAQGPMETPPQPPQVGDPPPSPPEPEPKPKRGLLVLLVITVACVLVGVLAAIADNTPSEDEAKELPSPNAGEDEFNFLRKAAEQGHAGSQRNLGLRYQNGIGVNKDMTEAVKWYRKAADQGYADAQNDLGVCYSKGWGVNKDMTEAVKWYRKAANQGQVDAQFTLGFYYENGRGVSKDMTEAVKWYRKAAEQGNADAQNTLGVCYADGNGVNQDMTEAVKWYRLAAEQGNAAAQSALREIANNPPRKDEPKKQPPQSYQNMEGGKQENELDSLREAAEQGEREAQKKLGYRYYSGDGVSQDMTEVVKWYRLAAEQGSALAQCNLGNCYYNGEGVDKDMAQAVKWYRAAAEQGNAQAQCNLGNCYYYGKGVGKDMAQAMKWYRAAAEQGNILAQNNLGNCYYYGRGVSKDMTQAVKWYRAAADRGEPLAQCNLGNCYFLGSGVGKDLKKAMKWYRLAAEQGNKIAQENLDKCRVSNSGVSVDDAELLEAESKDDVRKNFGSKDSPNALDEIRISGVNFDRTPIADVIDFLRGELKKVNKGVNIIYVPSQGTSGGRTAAEPEVTASFSDLSLRETLDGVCKSAGCTYKEKGRTIYIYQSK